MNRRAMFVSCAALFLLGGAESALAQDAHGYVGGSFFLSTQGSHTQGTSPDLPRTGVGGSTWGGTAEIGMLQGPVGLGAEITLPARIEATQEVDYFSTFRNRNRYRDLTVAFVAHASTPPARRVRAAAVGGFAMVQESTFQSTAYARCSFPCPASPSFGPFGQETEFTRWAPGVVGGVDVEIGIGAHASVVPQFRATWVSRSDDPSQPMWYLGLDALVLRGAIGLRAVF